ncbi:reverse transcriptase domain-containing protein [Tanacetum coccineum]
MPRISIKGQILVDFIVERPEEESPDELMAEPEELSEPWTLFTDGSSCIDGSGAGLILTNPEGVEFTYAMRFRFEATNNEAEYEALIAGLRIAEQMGIKNLQAKRDSRLVTPATSQRLVMVAKESIRVQYMKRKILPKDKKKARRYDASQPDAQKLIRECNDCQVHRPILRNPQQNLTPITSPWPFYKWGIDIAGPFPEGPGKVKFLIVAIDYFTKWIEAKPVATITGNQVKKFVWDNIVCRFGLPGEIVSDNGK